MFRRILIANRGEIALRIIRACKELGVEAVVAHSEADRDAIYLLHADRTICVGPAPSAESYLNIQSLISAAEQADVEAIHPGYGFLAENAHFAEICESCRIEFIGPSSDAISAMGDKSRAKEIARGEGVPVVPGSEEPVEDEREAIAIAHRLGYPVIIKAVAGGGGRGMRIAHNDPSLASSLTAARREAEVSFKNPAVYIEKYLDRPRHVEFQILGDRSGNIVHLGERDCSMQRRHQKLVEEAPSPGLDPRLRQEMGDAAVRLARAVEYCNAGTVEFLLDASGNWYFIEMNTRLQVEHPVTECVTGVDLVQEQLRIAAGERLTFQQEDVRINGAAIECRINAEDPARGFKPDPGLITKLFVPGGLGVRFDSHAYAGYRVPPHYDSMIGKLIVHGKDRAEALVRLRRALNEFVLEGVKTTIPFHLEIIAHPRFVQGQVDTGLLEAILPDRTP